MAHLAMFYAVRCVARGAGGYPHWDVTIYLHNSEEKIPNLLAQAELGVDVINLGPGAEMAEVRQAMTDRCCFSGNWDLIEVLTSATAGFEIACKYAGLRPGDEVIAPAITFIATIVYPLSIGAKVVLADLDPRTINMDPKDVERKITSRTKVIIPVHIGGYPVDMAPIMRLARKHDITVIEDAAHAFGGTYRGKPVGTIGHFGAFSFHEVKNINSLGEGGGAGRGADSSFCSPVQVQHNASIGL